MGVGSSLSVPELLLHAAMLSKPINERARHDRRIVKGCGMEGSPLMTVKKCEWRALENPSGCCNAMELGAILKGKLQLARKRKVAIGKKAGACIL